jgi:hypothetical protein
MEKTTFYEFIKIGFPYIVIKAFFWLSFCIFPWPRPGVQGLSSMDYTPKVLQLLYIVQAKSLQGGQFSLRILHWTPSKT